MNIQSLSSFCKSNKFTEIHKTIRENTNGYPYITFITSDNKAENIYFSKSKSSEVAAGMLISPSLLKDLQIATVTNANGESRTKLVGTGESNRLTLDDLL